MAAAKAPAKPMRRLRKAFAAGWVRYREMPDEEEPGYKVWKRIILQEACDMKEDGVLSDQGADGARGEPPVAGVFMVAAPFWHDHKV